MLKGVITLSSLDNIAYKPAVKKKKKKFKAKEGFRLFLLCSPFLLHIFIFSYFPLYGWSYAFFEYTAGYDLFDTPFVGFANFISIFENAFVRSDVIRVLRNTLFMSFIGIATSWLPMVFAIFRAEMNKNF
jgi:putative aldouronate transport system permease protein